MSWEIIIIPCPWARRVTRCFKTLILPPKKGNNRACRIILVRIRAHRMWVFKKRILPFRRVIIFFVKDGWILQQDHDSSFISSRKFLCRNSVEHSCKYGWWKIFAIIISCSQLTIWLHKIPWVIGLVAFIVRYHALLVLIT